MRGLFELILTKVFIVVENNLEDKENQRPVEKPRALLRACSKSEKGDTLENALSNAVDVGETVHAQDKDRTEYLRDKIKLNIENYRKRMVRRKQTRSYKDAHGQLLPGRGRGKVGAHRGRGRGSVTTDEQIGGVIQNSFLTLVLQALEKDSSDNEGGPIGGMAETQEENPGQETITQSMEGDGEAPEEEGNRTTGAMGRGRSRGGVRSQLVTRKIQKFLDEINEEHRDPNEPLEGADVRRGGTRGTAIRTAASKRSILSEEETAEKKPRQNPNLGKKSPGKPSETRSEAPPPIPEVSTGKGKSGGKGGPAKGASKQLTPAPTPPPPKPKATPSTSTERGLGAGAKEYETDGRQSHGR